MTGVYEAAKLQQVLAAASATMFHVKQFLQWTIRLAKQRVMRVICA